MFGLKMEEATGEWRKLHNEELHELYSSPNIWVIISRRMRWAGLVACMGKKRCVDRVLVGKSEGKIPPRRPKLRWDDNTKMDLKEIGCDCMEWLNVARTGTSGGLL
jgi:hypothetical protein